MVNSSDARSRSWAYVWARRIGAADSQTEWSIDMPATLYERLGGEERIKPLVVDVIDNHYRNPLIRSRFEKISDRAAFERHVVEFVSEQELIAAIDDILAAMTKNGYDQAEKNDVVAILYSLKGDVVRL
jgi:hemoglobin